MEITKHQEETLQRVLEKYLKIQYLDRLMQDYDIKQSYAEAVIKSAAIVDIYLDVKGSKDSIILGFKNKKELLKAIMLLSNHNGWIALCKISNERSLLRKIGEYKIEQQKGYYEGLAFLVSKKESNRTSPNAKKITEEQLEALWDITASNPTMSKSDVYEKMKLLFKDLNVKEGAVAYYLRNAEVNNFRIKTQ